MIRNVTRCCAILFVGCAASGCVDEYEQQFEAFHVNELRPDSILSVERAFPGAWDVLCIVASGSPPIGVIKSRFPGFDAAWLQEPKLHDSEYPDAFFKIVLFNRINYKLLILDKNEGNFSAAGCFQYKNATIHVGRKSSPGKYSPIPLDFVDPEPARSY